MKSIELKRPEKLVIRDMVKSIPKSHEVLVKIKYGGICGSDIHSYLGTSPFITFPRVLGHELLAYVDDNNGYNDFKKGDMVVIDPVLSCGECYACSVGRHNVCKDVKVFGVHTDGGFQEYVSIPAENLYKVPNGINPKLAALGEPLSIGFEANYRGKVAAEDTVLVIGTGTIGLMVAAVSKYIGAKVIVTDIDDKKLGIAHKLGVDYIINVRNFNAETRVKELTKGEGASVVIEAVGSIETIKNAINYASPAARVVILGIINKDIPLSISQLIKKEVDFLGSRLNNYMFGKVVEMLNKVDLSPLLDEIKVYSLEDVEKAFKEKVNTPELSIKSLINFD